MCVTIWVTQILMSPKFAFCWVKVEIIWLLHSWGMWVCHLFTCVSHVFYLFVYLFFSQMEVASTAKSTWEVNIHSNNFHYIFIIKSLESLPTPTTTTKLRRVVFFPQKSSYLLITQVWVDDKFTSSVSNFKSNMALCFCRLCQSRESTGRRWWI